MNDDIVEKLDDLSQASPLEIVKKLEEFDNYIQYSTFVGKVFAMFCKSNFI